MSKEQAASFLVVADGTEESRKALRYAALRARHTGGHVKLLHVIEPSQFQQWGGVQEAIEAEAEDQARKVMDREAAEIEKLLGKAPAMRLRKGKLADEVFAEVIEDRSIRGLVLAAAARDRPGPLVTFFSGERAGSLPCIVMIVPGGISEEDLDRLT